MISPSEARFIREGVAAGIRYDGRGILDLRNLTIETGVFVSANASSRVSRPYTGARVDCAVKVEMLRSSDAGKVEASVDCSALESSPEIEKQRCVLQVELNQMLGSIFAQQSLVVIENESSWAIYVDVMVAGTDGNLGDLVYVAVYAALYGLQKPVLSVYTHEGTLEKTFDVDPHHTEPFVNLARLLQLRVTLYELCPAVYVTDVSATEETCAYSTFSAVVNKKNLVCATHMSGSFDVDKIRKVLQTCMEIAAHLFKLLDAELDTSSTAPMVPG